jgi:hypothetical protein
MFFGISEILCIGPLHFSRLGGSAATLIGSEPTCECEEAQSYLIRLVPVSELDLRQYRYHVLYMFSISSILEQSKRFLRFKNRKINCKLGRIYDVGTTHRHSH